MKSTVKNCRFPTQTATILFLLDSGKLEVFPVHKMNKINPGILDAKEVRDNTRNKRKLSDTMTE